VNWNLLTFYATAMLMESITKTIFANAE
jgi:hypothetical protein